MLLNGHLSCHGYTIENRKPHAAISLCMMTRRSVRCGCVCGTCVRVCMCMCMCVNAKISCQLSPQKTGEGNGLCLAGMLVIDKLDHYASASYTTEAAELKSSILT